MTYDDYTDYIEPVYMANSDDKNKFCKKFRKLFYNRVQALIGVVYKEAISAVYGGDFISFNSQAKAYINDIKFCGKEFLMKLATQFCEQYQKEALADLD